MSCADSTFRFRVEVPRRVRVGTHELDREDFYAWLWQVFEEDGIVGVHEGTLLTPEAAEMGLETESWTVDAGEAPRDRDWMASQEFAHADLYFGTRKGAESAAGRLPQLTGLHSAAIGAVEEQKAEDWDAQWKASFLGSADGVEIAPLWRVLPPWVTADDLKAAGRKALRADEVVLKINPGAGFGTGTHETTQLCLQLIAESSQRAPLKGEPVLDFGSGSGILAIGAALLGGRVDAVEIDRLAIDNAIENARLNAVETAIRYAVKLDELTDAPAQYRMVIANILRPVLIEFAPELVRRIRRPGGTLILSGLIESDLPQIISVYSQLIGAQPRRLALNEWRGLCWES